MDSISRLSEECKKCSYVKKCNNKRMEACAFIKLPEKLSNDCVAPLTNMLSTPISRTHTPITIKMGEYGNINTSLEEIQKQIEQNLYSALQIPSCKFNGGGK